MIVESVTMGVEQIDVQLVMDHCVVIEREVLQFKSMRELRKKS